MRLVNSTRSVAENAVNTANELYNTAFFMPPGDERDAMMARARELNNEADRLILELFRDMYRNEADPVRFLLRKDLFEILEKAIDRCRDAGNVVYAIVLKNS